MKALNTLFILSDEHNRQSLGCYGSDIVKTPNLDALAQRGTLFENAYCNSPICIPSRAALQTGQYAFQTSNWCNGNAYRGEVKGWGHHLQDTGHEVVSLGKLHFRSTDDDNGFSEEILPLHVLNGVGDILGSMRKERPPRDCHHTMASDIGPGKTSYQQYDLDVTTAACEWLEQKAAAAGDKPWTLFVSLICPHFPLISPQEFYELYDADKLPLPKAYLDEDRVTHPALKALQEYLNYDEYFDEEKVRIATASYYGLISFIDRQIGIILDSLKKLGLEDSTRIIYSSDHGDNLGARGFWGKSTMHAESAGVPMILAGPDVPVAQRVSTPVSLVDLAPTLIEFNGEQLSEKEKKELPGRNLIEIAKGEDKERGVFCEYHAIGSITGFFMMRTERWKYNYYVGFDCELFDMENDPEEMNNLGTDEEFEAVRRDMHQLLLNVCDPHEVNERAFSDQADRVAENGGSEAVMNHETIPYTPAPSK
ncbi:MAG: sulfatase-like hydrolase/transferase [Lentisphaeraceae bacterium]|nr:sulfatase-like hydrolase/transferase [Lentisphaeraceae bacterium]